jgi:type VI secretion system secreted protein VgrG
MKHTNLSRLAGVGFAALLWLPSLAAAQSYLGSNLQPFAVLGGSTVTNTAFSVITGDVGLSPGSSVTGFPPGVYSGTLHVADAPASSAQTDLTTAFNTLTNLQPCEDLTGTDLGGLTLTPGVYCFSTSAQLTGVLTLNAQGNPNAVWVFRIGSTLTTASNASVRFINGSSANACGAQWRVGTSATLGTGTSFAGNILAQSSITLNTNANVIGRVLARTGAVTLDDNDISFAGCSGNAPPPFPEPTPVPTLPVWAIMALLALLSVAGFAALRRRAA